MIFLFGEDLMSRLALLFLFVFTGCFHANDPDDDFRTVPVTNNPNIVPNYGNGMPGVGGPSQGPF
jgi:hypothetical protein